MRGRRTGFSIVELMAALGILGVLVGGAVLGWARVADALRLDAGLRQLAADLQEARTLAVASASGVRVVFQVGSRVYRRERQDDAGVYAFRATRTLPEGVRIAGANSGGDLVFTSRGQAENGTIVLVGRRGVTRSLVLNQRGRVTVLQADS